jgi:hypothetical protein
MRYENTKSLSDINFKRLTGVKRHTFKRMVDAVSAAYREKHKKGGRNSDLSIEDMILLTLSYLRSYATFMETGFNFGVSESTAHRITVWVEDVLISNGTFALPSKKVLVTELSAVEVILVDVTEQEIERPKKGQKAYYSGKKNVTP